MIHDTRVCVPFNPPKHVRCTISASRLFRYSAPREAKMDDNKTSKGRRFTMVEPSFPSTATGGQTLFENRKGTLTSRQAFRSVLFHLLCAADRHQQAPEALQATRPKKVSIFGLDEKNDDPTGSPGPFGIASCEDNMTRTLTER